MPPDCRVTVIAIVLHAWKLNFLYEFETANQPEFEPGSVRPKAAMLTIELNSIDLYPIVLNLIDVLNDILVTANL